MARETVQIEKTIPTHPILTAKLEAAYPSALQCTSADVNFFAAYFDEGTDTTQAAAIINGHGALTITPDKIVIAADGVDTATLTIMSPSIAGDGTLIYEVFGRDGALDFAGTVAESGGVASYPFKTFLADTYRVRLARSNGLEDGYIEVVAE